MHHPGNKTLWLHTCMLVLMVYVLVMFVVVYVVFDYVLITWTVIPKEGMLCDLMLVVVFAWVVHFLMYSCGPV